MRRRLLVIPVLAAALLPVAPAVSAPQQYHNQDMGYSFAVPDGWVKIPQDKVNQFATQSAQALGLPPTLFVVGYQKKSGTWFSYPYLLVQHHQAPNASVADLVKEVNKASVKVKPKPGNDMLDSTSFGTASADPKRSMLLMPIQLEPKGGPSIRGLTGMKPGLVGVVQVNFYSHQAEFEKNRPALRTVFDSLKFDRGAEVRRK